MGAPRNDKKAIAMRRLYEAGFSLADVGKAFGSSRQSVYKMLKKRGVLLRQPKRLPFIFHNGHKYTIRADGYYRRTAGGNNRRALHQDVWENTHGPIPDGMEIHHKDNDKTNNEISNLECLTSTTHAYRHRKPKPAQANDCRHCGTALRRKRRPGGDLESLYKFSGRKFCNQRCMSLYRRDKPPGTKAP